MKTYIGTKIVKAEPMSELEGCPDKTVEINSSGNSKKGYKVVYEDGYESWSPKEVFERCYREISQKEKELI